VRSKFAVFVDTYGVAMLPEEVRPPDSVPSVTSEGTQPKDSPKEDPDKIRGEVFKRMFPDVSRKSPE
jgi:hypothetical protein